MELAPVYDLSAVNQRQFRNFQFLVERDSSEDQLLAMLRGQLTDIVFGAVILFIGLTACSIAAVRRRSGVRLIIWLSIWSAMYGTDSL